MLNITKSSHCHPLSHKTWGQNRSWNLKSHINYISHRFFLHHHRTFVNITNQSVFISFSTSRLRYLKFSNTLCIIPKNYSSFDHFHFYNIIKSTRRFLSNFSTLEKYFGQLAICNKSRKGNILWIIFIS